MRSLLYFLDRITYVAVIVLVLLSIDSLIPYFFPALIAAGN